MLPAWRCAQVSLAFGRRGVTKLADVLLPLE
jgi:hypothetical protein